MKTVVIVQARVGSTRLPGKVLRVLGGQTVLGRVIQRLRRCQNIDELVVATTDQVSDDAVALEAQRHQVCVARGSESNVLSRYHHAANLVKADEIVRVTSDCPLIDPTLIDQMVDEFHRQRNSEDPIDYLSNTHPRTYPHGLDAELFTFEALATAHREANQPYEREHVTPFFYLHPDRFRLQNMAQELDQSSLRWTLDEPDDQAFFEAVFAHFPSDAFVSTSSVLELLERKPELRQINAHVEQKSLKAS